ncbi:MAG TPA: hypothetical protein CFH84_06135 [Sulfurimonas sp. UBA12504]|nr:MAG: hypothetical protein A2019_04730 [Sulfurimonas sp. GWF2_37_8]DAB30051.1 MAG TPA: hypothetical protein CFH84_06135 [Sulfurimonas sp. UBA12504]
MRKILLFLGLVVSLYGDMLHMKIGGEKIELRIIQSGAIYKSASRQNQFQYQNTSDILVEFYEVTPLLVSSFEEKYHLKLKQIMVIGYYIYEKDGEINEIVKQIANEANVKTVKPNFEIPIIFY